LDAMSHRPDLSVVDADFVHLFSSWFNRGFLVLRDIDWSTPANILEKIIQHEAVHKIRSWDDLRRRIDPPDRCCFAFFHPALYDEPLIFVEVALTDELPGAIGPILAAKRETMDKDDVDTAVFYSISNCQRGLAGVSFGNFLIKQVAEDLGREFPRLKTFATLSPIPGFRRWLAETAATHAELGEIAAALAESDWIERAAPGSRVQSELMRLCAWYLLHAKHDTEPADSVARFHLGNGARMEKLNWLADTSKPGMQRSAGIMVNYVYRLADVEKNHEAFVHEHEVAASHELKKLARDCVLAAPAARA